MTIVVETTARYREDPHTLFLSALDFGELASAMKGMAIYKGLPDGPVAEGQIITVDVTFWGAITSRGHRIEVETVDPDAPLIQSRESNPSVHRWDHTLTFEPTDGGAIWRDRVAIDAGWRSFGVARFAGYIYRRRHRSRGGAQIETRYAKEAA